MKLETKSCLPGDWIVVDAGLEPNDLARHTIRVGTIELPTFVSGANLMARCPDALGRHRLAVDGAIVDTIVVSERSL